jgi:hypothetical protein
MRSGPTIVACALCALAIAACSGNPGTPSPASPSSLPVTTETFVGAWTSASSAAAVPIAACSRFDYTVDRLSNTTVNLKVAATCASVTIDASGSGTITASALNWTARGTATGASGAECTFSFADSSATPLNDGTIRIDYKGKVCGVPVSGSEVVRKR